MRPDSWWTDRQIGRLLDKKKMTWFGKHPVKVIDRYLGGSPVNPAFTIGVDVEQNQTLHQVGEDQLESDDIGR